MKTKAQLDADIAAALAKRGGKYGKTGTRTESGRCSECGASGFTYNNGYEESASGVRGYRCMTCGTIKPERGAPGKAVRGRAHSTMKTEGPQVLARWESRSGKHWVELTQHDSVTIANAMDPTSVGGRAFTWYGYTSPGNSGSLGVTSSAAAIAEMEQRVKRGDFLPDAAKTSMKRVR